MSSGLHKYILQKRKRLQARQGQPAAPATLAARVVAEGRSGVRRIHIRDFQVISDGAPAGAGFDLGPAPGELLIGAVAACLNHGYLIQAAVLDITLDSLEVSAEATIQPGAIGDGAQTPVELGFRYVARLSSPATDAQLEHLRQQVERHSFVYNVVTRGSAIAGRVEREQA